MTLEINGSVDGFFLSGLQFRKGFNTPVTKPAEKIITVSGKGKTEIKGSGAKAATTPTVIQS